MGPVSALETPNKQPSVYGTGPYSIKEAANNSILLSQKSIVKVLGIKKEAHC